MANNLLDYLNGVGNGNNKNRGKRNFIDEFLEQNKEVFAKRSQEFEARNKELEEKIKRQKERKKTI